MDVFRFAKLPMRAKDPTRRYRLVRGPEGDHVGSVEVGRTAPAGDTVVLTLNCLPVLSDAAREDALATARRFLGELVAGWGARPTRCRPGRADGSSSRTGASGCGRSTGWADPS